MLYPQNGDRVVTVDSVTSPRPMHTQLTGLFPEPERSEDYRNAIAGAVDYYYYYYYYY